MGREGSNGGSSGESPSKLEAICIDRGELEKVPGAKGAVSYSREVLSGSDIK